LKNPTDHTLAHFHHAWKEKDGDCPACIQQDLLRCLLEHGDQQFHQRLQACWPLDPKAVYGALPTPLRLHADHRYTGRGVTICFIDSGFYPHPDLTKPKNRIKAWVNAGKKKLEVHEFGAHETPAWPNWDDLAPSRWHGLMTSCVGAGNGYLGGGLYRGLASEADVVLICIRDAQGHLTEESIVRALDWVERNASRLDIRVVNLSVAGDQRPEPEPNEVDRTVDRLVSQGLVVTAASGNDGRRVLAPPATSPSAITVGGIDDKNSFDHEALEMWHSNYGVGIGQVGKPELVAPSMWVVAPLLCGSTVAEEAQKLFDAKELDSGKIWNERLVTPHYKHVEGTSFAAPLCASAVACLIEAVPDIHPHTVKEVLLKTAERVKDASPQRQGAGVLRPGLAVAEALRHDHEALRKYERLPHVTKKTITFFLHDHDAQSVQVVTSWSGWQESVDLDQVEPGIWKKRLPLPEKGRHHYKFVIDDRWLDDPSNPKKEPDGFGGYNSVLEL